jgi:hypothetical protein
MRGEVVPGPPSAVPGPPSIPSIRSPVTTQAPAANASRAPVSPARVRPGSGGIGRIAVDSISMLLSAAGQLVFVVADPDVVVAVAAQRRAVEPLIRTPQPVEPARVGRVGVIHVAVG